jgi:hypothetical protein
LENNRPRPLIFLGGKPVIAAGITLAKTTGRPKNMTDGAPPHGYDGRDSEKQKTLACWPGERLAHPLQKRRFPGQVNHTPDSFPVDL